MARRRLFRKRTTWDVVKGNMHIVVTVGALFTMLYAWSGDSTPNHPAPFQAAADPVVAGTPAPESTSSLEELLPPDSSKDKPSAVQTAQATAPAPVTPAARPLATPAAPVVQASQIAPPPALPIVPAVARQTLAEAAPVIAPPPQPRADTTGIREQRRSMNSVRGHTTRAQTTHRTRAKPPIVTAKARARTEKPNVKVAERDPFSCAIRKKQPCF